LNPLVRAIVFDRFQGPVHVREVPDPQVPDGGVVVRVHATGLCLSDWHAWSGHDADITTLPHVPGHELAGTVAQVGAGVTGWHVGDRVTVPFVSGCGTCRWCRTGQAQVCPDQTQPGFTHWGSYAELVVLHTADTNLVAVPTVCRSRPRRASAAASPPPTAPSPDAPGRGQGSGWPWSAPAGWASAPS
jgi:alcohol dehydrogenase